MLRKRDCWTRERAKRSRPKRLAPKAGWSLAELARITEVSVSTLRYYVRRRLLRPLEFRGTATRYDRRELLTLLGMLQRDLEGATTLAEKKRSLDALTEPALERLVTSRSIPHAAAAALGLEPSRASTAISTASERWVLASNLGSEPTWRNTVEQERNETWYRMTLVPGVELRLRADVYSVVQAGEERGANE